MVKPFLEVDPSLAHVKIAKGGETILHISTRLVRELVKLMEVGDLEVRNDDESTAFCLAATSGVVEVAGAMWERHANLPNICNKSGTPILKAAVLGNKDMDIWYHFFSMSHVLRIYTRKISLCFLKKQSRMTYIATKIFDKYRFLATTIEGNRSVFNALAKKSL
ncbi:uncharacterized protein [Nicotiana tomentosiformis]|uniref:uncharacterized protein n=1 Tax=Nicotiana tomentosiformis TaxID=4098 RepID=UPI00388C5CA9